MPTKRSEAKPVARRGGRPPAGTGADGSPELVSKYPKLTISMRAETKSRLEAVSTLTRCPAWRVIDEAVGRYMESLPVEDRRAVEGLAKRMNGTGQHGK